MGALGITLLVLAGLAYLASVAAVLSLHSSDAAGNALGHVWTVFLTAGMWVLLAALLAVAAWKGQTPRWANWAALVLTPACAAASLAAIELWTRHARWPLIVPIAAPLLAAASLRWPWAWAPAAVLAVAPWLASKPKPRPAPPPVEESSELPRTQAEAEDMLRHGMTYLVRDLPQMNLQMTPAVCEGVRRALRQLTDDLRRDPSIKGPLYFTAAASVNEYKAGLAWAVERGCACGGELAGLESVIQTTYQDTPARREIEEFLSGLKSQH